MEFHKQSGCFIHHEKSLLLRKKLTVLTLEPPTSSPHPQTQLNQHHTKTHTQKLPPIYITQWLGNKSTLIMNVATSHWKWCLTSPWTGLIHPWAAFISNWEQLPTPKDRVKPFGYIQQAGLIFPSGYHFPFFLTQLPPYSESVLS